MIALLILKDIDSLQNATQNHLSRNNLMRLGLEFRHVFDQLVTILGRLGVKRVNFKGFVDI